MAWSRSLVAAALAVGLLSLAGHAAAFSPRCAYIFTGAPGAPGARCMRRPWRTSSCARTASDQPRNPEIIE